MTDRDVYLKTRLDEVREQLGSYIKGGDRDERQPKRSPPNHYQVKRLGLSRIRLRGLQIRHQMLQQHQFRLQPHHMLKDMAGQLLDRQFASGPAIE
jgi:hypothetical protein